MAASFNRVYILGNLGGDPELRYTQNQTPVVTLSVATTDYRRSGEGGGGAGGPGGPGGGNDRGEVTEWHKVVVWSKQAENCAKYLKKGRTIFVEGRIQTRSWLDKNGEKRYTTEIVAQNVQFIGAPKDTGDMQDNYGGGGFDQRPSSGNQGPSDIDFNSLDDIPF